jgi:hypothetical protein
LDSSRKFQEKAVLGQFPIESMTAGTTKVTFSLKIELLAEMHSTKIVYTLYAKIMRVPLVSVAYLIQGFPTENRNNVKSLSHAISVINGRADMASRTTTFGQDYFVLNV